MTYVMEAIELEDTIKNYERRESTGWFVHNLCITLFYNLPAILVA